MQQDKQTGQSSEEAAEGRQDVPPPEQGSPQVAPDPRDDGQAARKVEKGEDSDPNPLAPPVNTQAGS